MRGSRPERVRQRGDVAAGRRADVRHRVDERDLGGQERVGRALGQLRRGQVGQHQRDARVGLRPVDLPDRRGGGLGHRADHDAVGAEGVRDRAPLPQELGVPRHLDPALPGPEQPVRQRLEAGRGARRHRRLPDDQAVALQVRDERGHHRLQLRHVVGAVRVARRRHPDEVDGGELGRLGETGGEAQSPGGDVLRQHRVQIGLVEPALARVQQAYLALIDVHPDDLVPERGHARGVRGTQVPAADHRHLH